MSPWRFVWAKLGLIIIRSSHISLYSIAVQTVIPVTVIIKREGSLESLDVVPISERGIHPDPKVPVSRWMARSSSAPAQICART